MQWHSGSAMRSMEHCQLFVPRSPRFMTACWDSRWSPAIEPTRSTGCGLRLWWPPNGSIDTQAQEPRRRLVGHWGRDLCLDEICKRWCVQVHAGQVSASHESLPSNALASRLSHCALVVRLHNDETSAFNVWSIRVSPESSSRVSSLHFLSRGRTQGPLRTCQPR